MSNTTSLPKSQPAYCEEFNEESNTVLPGTRQSANIAAKRSKPDIDVKKQAVVVAERRQDDASDLAYSSQAGATLTSRASSLQDSKAENFLPLTPSRRRASKRESIDGAMAPPSRQGSPEKPLLQRKLSRSQRNENLRSEGVESRDSAARMRVTGEPVDAPRRQSHLRHTGPPSPQATRPRITEEYEEPVLRPATARPRPNPSQSYHSRPLSYHAATASEGNIIPGQPPYTRRPESLYINTFTYQAPVQPPPAAYMPSPFGTSPQRQPSYPFPQTTFAPPYQPPAGPWVEPMRASSRRSSMYSARAPTEYSPVQQLYTPGYPTGPALPRRLSHHHGERISPVVPMAQPGSYLIEDGPDDDYYRMPPPPVPSSMGRSNQSRPGLRHAATTTTAHPTLHHRRSDHSAEIPYETFRRLSIEEQRPPSRKQSIDEPRSASRPSLVRGPSTSSATSSKYSKHNAAISPVNEREPSIQVPRMNRRPQSYYGAPTTDDQRQRDAEAYIESQQAGIRPLTTEEVKKIARRKSKTNDAGSGSGSRGHSSREGSDVKKSRNSLEKHPHSAGNSEVQIRQDENSGLSLTITNNRQGMQLGLKGGTINIRPGRSDGGQVQVRIESGASTVSSREGRVRSLSERRYSHTGRRREIEGRGESRRRSRSRVVIEGADQIRDTGSEREGRKGKDKEEKELKEVKEVKEVKEGNTIERFLRREKPSGSRSRRSSRSVVDRAGA